MSATPNVAGCRVADLPNGGRAYLVDCDLDYTRTDAPPEMVALFGDEAIARITAFHHRLECGRCDLGNVLAEVGRVPESLAELREVIAHVQQVEAKGRRN
jgi:hypothetical protein